MRRVGKSGLADKPFVMVPVSGRRRCQTATTANTMAIIAGDVALAVRIRLPVTSTWRAGTTGHCSWGDRSDTGGRAGREGSDETTTHAAAGRPWHPACRLGNHREIDPCHVLHERAAAGMEHGSWSRLRNRRVCPGQPVDERWPTVSRCGPDTCSCREQPCPGAERRGPRRIDRNSMVHGGRTRLGATSQRAAAVSERREGHRGAHPL